MYYPRSENKGADQMGRCEADLCLCFRIWNMLVFSRRGSFVFAILDKLSLPWELNDN